MAVSLEMIYKYVKILFEGNGQSESIEPLRHALTRFTFPTDRIEGYFGMLVELINLPLAGLLLFAVLRVGF